MPPPAEIDFHAVLGILRLSHKYDVDYLYKRALLHLETIYPVDLAKMDPLRSNKLHYIPHSPVHDLKAIPILHEVGATWLLPFAYYSVGTHYTPKLIMAGEMWDVLPVETKLTCALLQSHHLRASNRINSFLADRSQCLTAERCNSEKDVYIRVFLAERADYAGLIPLAEWTGTDWNDLGEIVCDNCHTAAQQAHDSIAAVLWDEIPQHCGLESWDVLKEKRRLALS
ncbi:hypothetical protein FB451DRAFT_1564247 [Mycena latifolia]|nr:hypothetical protein FB451DRAFT_1564247 [Mycena latifolia]